MRTEYKIRFIISTNVTKGMPEQLRAIFLKPGGVAMLRELAVNTRVIYYLMALLGIIGVLAKAVNQQTLNQMLKAAGNAESVDPGSRNNVQEYTPTDKTRKSKIRTCMYGA